MCQCVNMSRVLGMQIGWRDIFATKTLRHKKNVPMCEYANVQIGWREIVNARQDAKTRSLKKLKTKTKITNCTADCKRLPLGNKGQLRC
jgi:hypothetical protein